MEISKEEASNKNELVAAVLALFWGTFGIHRFYVGKWISGTIYFVIGRVSFLFTVLNYLGVNLFYSSYISIVASILVVVAVLYDLFAIKNESFTDSKNRLLISKATREDSGLFLSTKEQFITNSNAWIAFFAFALFAIIRFVILPEIDKVLF